MEGHNEFLAAEMAKFQEYHHKMFSLVYREGEDYRTELSGLLEELNRLEYSLKFVREETVGELLAQCCYLAPLKDERLVAKVCTLICNLVNKQQIVLQEKLETVTEYVIRGLDQCQTWVLLDLLRALGVLVYENAGRLTQYHEKLLGEEGMLIQLCKSPDEDVLRTIIQCMENLTMRTAGSSVYLEEEYCLRCYGVWLSLLQTPKPATMDTYVHCKLLMCALRGVQNLMQNSKCFPSDSVGPFLAALKVYSCYGIPGCPTVIPLSLYPTPLSQYDPSAKSDIPKVEKTEEKKSTSGKKGRRKKPQKKKQQEEEEEEEDLSQSVSEKTQDAYPQPWSRVSSSDSEYSDTEGGPGARTKSMVAKVRQCAFCCLHALVKTIDRRVMFGYWTCFIPDFPGSGGAANSPSLVTSIMNDPSCKARRAAVAVLTAMLEGSKQYLMAAEESDQYRNSPFTPFSVTLGYMIKEIHRCLLQVLSTETSLLALTQVIKCVATLIQNVPYQRLKPGLLSITIKQVKLFITHRDPNIRVACLTCLGSVAGAHAQSLEVNHILMPSKPHSHTSETLSPFDVSESGYGSQEGVSNLSASATPTKTHSGSHTPSSAVGMSWVVKQCLRNTAPHLLEGEGSGVGSSCDAVQPLPVRLESMQLLAQMTKSYFSILRPCLLLMRDLIHFSLTDKEPAVQLHGAKLLHDISYVLLQQQRTPDDCDMSEALQDLKLETAESASFAPVSHQQLLEVWLPLLSGPIPNLLQTADYQAVKSTLCDCLSNVGPSVFEQLPRDKHILCLTLLLGLTNDEDFHIRAAAVRGLGVYVLYPCLREDVSFMADAANAIITALQENSLGVRVKAAWALANLSDAIVMNKSDREGDAVFIQDFSDMLLLKMFDVAVRGSQDNNKVRSYAVRALGNLLRYLPEKSYGSSRFVSAVEQAIGALVKNSAAGIMKVRWNACYAIGNMFRNQFLLQHSAAQQHLVLQTLCEVIPDCFNFKVRINAAMSLAIPRERANYGNDYSALWESLTKALVVSEVTNDFTEYRYLDNLIEQICGTLVHLAALMLSSDAAALVVLVKNNEGVLQRNMHKYRLLIAKDTEECTRKRAELEESKKNLQKLISKTGEEERSALEVLLKVLTEYPPDSPEHSSPRTAFKQIYD